MPYRFAHRPLATPRLRQISLTVTVRGSAVGNGISLKWNLIFHRCLSQKRVCHPDATMRLGGALSHCALCVVPERDYWRARTMASVAFVMCCTCARQSCFLEHFNAITLPFCTVLFRKGLLLAIYSQHGGGDGKVKKFPPKKQPIELCILLMGNDIGAVRQKKKERDQ